MQQDIKAREAAAPKDLRGDSVPKKQSRALLDAIEALRRRYGQELEREVDEFNNATQAAVKEQSDKAIRGVGTAYGEALRDQLVRNRAAGLDAEKQLTYLRRSIEEEVRRQFPRLNGDEFARTVAELFRKVKDDVRDMVAKLEAEGLDAAQALRRLDMERRQRHQAQQEKLAGDEFQQFAAAQFDQFRRLFNRGLPQATPDQLRAAGEQMRKHLEGLGVSARDQARIGRSLNDPRNARRAGGILQDLMGSGLFDERGAFEALPGVLGAAEGRTGNEARLRLNRAIRNAVNERARRQQADAGAMIRAQQDEANLDGGMLGPPGRPAGRGPGRGFRSLPAEAPGAGPAGGGPAHVVAGNTDALLHEVVGLLRVVAHNTGQQPGLILRR
jgi:hypothetical protein